MIRGRDGAASPSSVDKKSNSTSWNNRVYNFQTAQTWHCCWSPIHIGCSCTRTTLKPNGTSIAEANFLLGVWGNPRTACRQDARSRHLILSNPPTMPDSRDFWLAILRRKTPLPTAIVMARLKSMSRTAGIAVIAMRRAFTAAKITHSPGAPLISTLRNSMLLSHRRRWNQKCRRCPTRRYRETALSCCLRVRSSACHRRLMLWCDACERWVR